MQTAFKRNLFRVLLVGHFIGLTLAVGVRFADFVVESQTGHQSLQALALGQALTGTLAKTLVAPGFLLMIVTGVSMLLLRYGLRPPVWLWIKMTVTIVAVIICLLYTSPSPRDS